MYDVPDTTGATGLRERDRGDCSGGGTMTVLTVTGQGGDDGRATESRREVGVRNDGRRQTSLR